MSLIVDISIIAIIALFTLWGYYRGLIKVAFKIITFFAAILVTLLLFRPVSNLVIEKTDIDEKIETAIIESFSSKEETEEIKEEDLKKLPQIVSSYVKEYTQEVQNATVSAVAKEISKISINIGVAIALFLLTKLILLLFKALSEA